MSEYHLQSNQTISVFSLQISIEFLEKQLLTGTTKTPNGFKRIKPYNKTPTNKSKIDMFILIHYPYIHAKFKWVSLECYKFLKLFKDTPIKKTIEFLKQLKTRDISKIVTELKKFVFPVKNNDIPNQLKFLQAIM